ncbi:hypothetical protein SARC_05577 [Sphaeroforma arctica JP610]|uniref:Uncharacterized protein n=1 Tax=Sphaeroforma arctica JP610 TaxID=667725 RepID=A0A0L0FZ84_9EUKA|nr:hypothetical protein SARC_05577 [Sphaeroforma arctica JP610]KNC82125.1 hypothetical protein SARC_05577 [Sphaeroforma arctica JP610]|eukprot:XP_014156027.1 hypothetical protein SARC_05577 [Sphaeroforma arctica JP610]
MVQTTLQWTKLGHKWWAHLIAAANTEYKDDVEGVLRYKYVKREILAKQISTPIHNRTPTADTAKIEGINRFRRKAKTNGTYQLAKSQFLRSLSEDILDSLTAEELSEDKWALLIYIRRAFEHNSATVNNSIAFDLLKSFSPIDDDMLRTWCKRVTSIATMASKQNTIFSAVFVQGISISGLSAADKDVARQYLLDVPNRDDISILLLCERIGRWNNVAPVVNDTTLPEAAATSTTSAVKQPPSAETLLHGLTNRLDAIEASRSSTRPPTPCFHLLTKIETAKSPLLLADDTQCIITERGSLSTLGNAYLSPTVQQQLVSQNKLQDHVYDLHFPAKQHTRILSHVDNSLTVPRTDGGYQLSYADIT